MNAVEIEQAISALAEQPFDADEFPYAFLQAFGNRLCFSLLAPRHANAVIWKACVMRPLAGSTSIVKIRIR